MLEDDRNFLGEPHLRNNAFGVENVQDIDFVVALNGKVLCICIL